jgi:hypothetical protein
VRAAGASGMPLRPGRMSSRVGAAQDQIRGGLLYHFEHVAAYRRVARNWLSWDCILSCEMILTYNTQPQAYRICAQWLRYRPDQLLMVACHNFDLMAERAEAMAAPSCTVRRSGPRRPARSRTRPSARHHRAGISPTWLTARRVSLDPTERQAAINLATSSTGGTEG